MKSSDSIRNGEIGNGDLTKNKINKKLENGGIYLYQVAAKDQTCKDQSLWWWEQQEAAQHISGTGNNSPTPHPLGEIWTLAVTPTHFHFPFLPFTFCSSLALDLASRRSLWISSSGFSSSASSFFSDLERWVLQDPEAFLYTRPHAQ